MIITHEPEHRDLMDIPASLDSKPTESRASAIRRSLLEACRCAQIADGFKGDNTLVLDLTKITPIFDFFVLTTGTSRRQMLAIAEEINKRQKQSGAPRQALDGNDQSQWIVQDYGDSAVVAPAKRAGDVIEVPVPHRPAVDEPHDDQAVRAGADRRMRFETVAAPHAPHHRRLAVLPRRRGFGHNCR